MGTYQDWLVAWTRKRRPGRNGPGREKEARCPLWVDQALAHSDVVNHLSRDEIISTVLSVSARNTGCK